MRVIVWAVTHRSQSMGHVFPSRAQREKGERGSEIWRAEVDWPALPDVGEVVEWDVGPDDSASLPVKRRSFDMAGGASVELVEVQVDPNEVMGKHCDGKYRVAWHSEEGDVDAKLQAGGFVNTTAARTGTFTNDEREGR